MFCERSESSVLSNTFRNSEGGSHLPRDLRLRFLESVQKNDIDELRRLVKSVGVADLSADLSLALLDASCRYCRVEIFNYLLFLRRFNLNPQSGSILGWLAQETAPMSAYFVSELIRKGANVHYVDSEGNTLLHHAVMAGNFELVRIFVGYGVEVNARNGQGDTALHKVTVREVPRVVSILGILLWNGVDLSIRNKDGDTAFDALVGSYRMDKEFHSSNEIQAMNHALETLFFYTYEDVVPCKVILKMMKLQLPLLDQVFEYIREITVDNKLLKSQLCGCLLSLEVKYLKELVGRFDYVIVELLQTKIYNFYVNPITIEALDYLLHSHLVNYLMRFIKKITISALLEIHYPSMYQLFAIDESVIIELIYYLLSYGLVVYEKDLESVYNNFGYCDLFRLLLHMDIKRMPHYKKDIWLCLLYDFGVTDIEDFYEHSVMFSWKNAKQLLPYYAHQNLKGFCRDFYYNNRPIMARMDRLPEIPSLVELARNAFRKFFVKKFNITSSQRFYRLLKCLPISDKHEKIITLETELYY